MKLNKSKTMSAVAIAAALVTLGAGAAQAATRYVNPDGLCGGNSPCYTTIQAAVNAASSGETIEVADATYNELVQVTKTLTLNGSQHGTDARARSGAESIVGSGDGAFQIEADNVIIDGFTIQGVTNNPSNPPFTGLGAGVWTNPGFSGTQGGYQIINNIIQNNIVGIYLQNVGTLPAKVQFNLIRTNNASGPAGGTGVYSDSGLSNVLIDNNKFIGQTSESINMFAGAGSITISNNTLDVGIALFACLGITINGNSSIGNTVSGTVYLGGGDSAITISSNVLNNGVEGIVSENIYGVGPNSAVTVSPNNCIAGNSTNGLRVASGSYTGALGATNNWWGAASGPNYNGGGPGTGDKITDPDHVVTFSPFLTSKAGTPCAPPPVGPPTNANQCKNNGWQTFNTPRSFKNQGDCIQYVNTGK
jgi:hypothetical protein